MAQSLEIGTDPLDVLGERLRTAAKRSGETQSSLAQRLGIAQTTVSAWMRGKTDLSLRQAIALSRILGVSLNYLAGVDQGEQDRKLTPRERAILNLAAMIEEEGPEAVAERAAPRSPSVGRLVGKPVIVELKD